MKELVCRSAVLVLFFLLTGVSAISNSTQDCTPVTCMNGNGTLMMDERIMEKLGDCEHGLYNETDHFLVGADPSGVMNYSCDPQIRTQNVTWKNICDDKTRNHQTCFMITGHSEQVSDDKHTLLYLLALLPAAVGIYGLYICCKKNKDKGYKHAAGENQNNGDN